VRRLPQADDEKWDRWPVAGAHIKQAKNVLTEEDEQAIKFDHDMAEL
jgi:hypothetical protein